MHSSYKIKAFLLSILCFSALSGLFGCGKATSSDSLASSSAAADTTATTYENVSETTTYATQAPTLPVAEPDVSEYVRVVDYIPDIVVDLRYATADNFTGQIIYDFTDAYLRYGTVVKLKAAQEQLKALGYKIKIWDAYRPYSAQQLMWEIYPDSNYVANPNYGFSGHNLGGTMDITLVTLDGSDVEMPTGFDDFSTRADRNYSEVNPEAAKHAQLLEDIMTANDFTGYFGEWWDYTDNTKYAENTDFIPAE